MMAGGNRRGRILRAFALDEVVVAGVGEEVELLRLPWLQALQQRLVHFARLRQLRREDRWVARHFERFDRNDAGGLMVPVIFSDEEARHPGEDHGWASEAHDTHNLLEDRAVAPVGEGLKDILARRIF